MRGWPTEVKIAPAALDPAQRRRLWEVSEELVGGRVGVAA
jgi:protochlorophyllide reductase